MNYKKIEKEIYKALSNHDYAVAFDDYYQAYIFTEGYLRARIDRARTNMMNFEEYVRFMNEICERRKIALDKFASEKGWL